MTRQARRAYMRERNAQRRAMGLCISCPMPSPRFWRCACCRLLWAEKMRQWARAYYRRRREAVNAKRRASYRASKEMLVQYVDPDGGQRSRSLL